MKFQHCISCNIFLNKAKAELCIDYWYSQKSSYDFNNPKENDFAQLIWASSTSVGFGFNTFRFNGRTVYVCVAHFYPAGNSGSFDKNVGYGASTTKPPLIKVPLPNDCLETFRTTALNIINGLRAQYASPPLQRVASLDIKAQALSDAAANEVASNIKLDNYTGSNYFLKWCNIPINTNDLNWCASKK